MTTVNQGLQDWAIDHEHDLRRFANGVVQRIIAVLNRTDARLTAQLGEALLRLDRESFTVERLNTLIESVRSLNQQAYVAILVDLQSEMKDLAGVESTAQASGMRAALPAQVLTKFPVAAVSADQVYAAAVSRPFQGRLLRDWASNLEASRLNAIRNAVRAGFVEGKTTSDIIKSIRGSRAMNYRDGILERPRRELAAVVQTALSHTAQTARQSMMDANADLVKAVEWVSTLDTRTSPMCRIRDGLRYTADTHKPIGHSIPWGEGPGRLHFNCRSVSVPVLKSWRELGIDADEMPAGARASMDGQVPADQTYAQWFAKQPAARQDEILGPERAKMYRSGNVSFGQFYNDKGQFLTLSKLSARSGA
ncbi:phage minor head protein [Dyella kyungheensis]|uniref:phage minor head protein n=1 Tax=Dyella kyungheensis TaxID=1242174 RepID=UPI003CEE7FFE